MNDAWNRQRPHNWQSKSSAPWDIWVCRQSPVYGQDLPWHLHWSSWVWPASAAGWWHRAAVASGGKPHQQLTAAHLRKDESIDYNTNWKDTEKKPVVFMIYDQWRKKRQLAVLQYHFYYLNSLCMDFSQCSCKWNIQYCCWVNVKDVYCTTQEIKVASLVQVALLVFLFTSVMT